MDIAGTVIGAGWGLLSYVVPFLFVLTVVVFFHELGHFWVARRCGVAVQAFSIGFGRELVGWTDRQGTRWRISAIPLGGYVRFAGDANSASMPDRDALDTMSEAERRGSFYHKGVGARAAIVAAGPIANFLLAIAIFTASVYLGGRAILLPRVDAVEAGSAAERAGIRPGDLVLSIDGRPVESFADMQRIISARPGEALAVTVERDGSEVMLTATPDLREMTTPFGKQRIGLLGLRASRDPGDWTVKQYGIVDSLRIGLTDTWYIVERTGDYVGKLLTGRESTDQLSGPIRIAQVSGEVASMGGLAGLINLAAILSVSIGLINLVPVPMLDGGHLLFYAIEAVRGRPLSEQAQEIGFKIGLALVLMLMLFVTWNDLQHLGAAFGLGAT